MELGASRSVDLREYINLLSQAGFKEDATALRKVLGEQLQSETTTFYEGPENGDGSMVMLKDRNDVSRGVLLFKETGEIFDTSKKKMLHRMTGTNNELAECNNAEGFSEQSQDFVEPCNGIQLGGIFIAGVFSEKELSNNLGVLENIVLSGILYTAS